MSNHEELLKRVAAYFTENTPPELLDVRTCRHLEKMGVLRWGVSLCLIMQSEILSIKLERSTMSTRELYDLLTRAADHLRKHTPPDQLNAHTNEQLKREGKPNGGEAPRLLVDIELEILKLQRQ